MGAWVFLCFWQARNGLNPDVNWRPIVLRMPGERGLATHASSVRPPMCSFELVLQKLELDSASGL
jgi:hypothetical protein